VSTAADSMSITEIQQAISSNECLVYNNLVWNPHLLRFHVTISWSTVTAKKWYWAFSTVFPTTAVSSSTIIHHYALEYLHDCMLPACHSTHLPERQLQMTQSQRQPGFTTRPTNTITRSFSTAAASLSCSAMAPGSSQVRNLFEEPDVKVLDSPRHCLCQNYCTQP